MVASAPLLVGVPAEYFRLVSETSRPLDAFVLLVLISADGKRFSMLGVRPGVTVGDAGISRPCSLYAAAENHSSKAHCSQIFCDAERRRQGALFLAQLISVAVRLRQDLM